MVIYGILENDRPGAGRFWRVEFLELRIATASVRTGFAMTGGFARGAVVGGRRDTWVPPYTHFCRAGPVCPAVGAGKLDSGRCRHRPLRKRILWCVGEGLSCPPSCQPTDGHCRTRQSGHFLETGLLHPPLAALRRFPLPRATARVAPTGGLQGVRCKDVSPSHGFAVPAPFRQGGRGDGGRIATGALRPRNDRSRKNLRVIPRPVRRLVVGIRNTPAQRSRRTDCHSQCAHWLRNDTL